MKVNPGQLATVLEVNASNVSMAILRKSLHKTIGDSANPDGLIDIYLIANHKWICKQLTKKGREIPQDIKILFLATPITDDKKSNQKNNVNNQANIPLAQGNDGADNGAGTHEVGASEADKPPSEGKVDPAEAERQKVAIESSQVSRDLDKAKLADALAKASISEINAAEKRRELIKINPFGRMLFNIKSAERSQVLNAIPNIAQLTLDEIKSALNDGIHDAETLMTIQKLWKSEISKIYKATDRELSAKLRQAKNQLIVTDDDNSIDVGAGKDNIEGVGNA